MDFPSSAIFAFNANIDHVKVVDEADLRKIESFSPNIYLQMDESFSFGVQREIAIGENECKFFLSEIKFDKKIVGGQAGNAAQQASALGVKCYLHTNFANEELLSLFYHPEKIMVAKEDCFVCATEFSSSVKSAHHFVFERRETRTRFIASFDPTPHLDEKFCRHIKNELPSIKKAFVGGFHLISSPQRFHSFMEEMKRWKEINPKLQVFAELGEFQNKEVMEKARRELIPFADIIGLTETELSALGVDLKELAAEANALLFHTPEKQIVLPEEKLNRAALEFAKKCAAYRAKTGKIAKEADLVGFSPEFVEEPVETVGLGDIFSCAYFLCI